MAPKEPKQPGSEPSSQQSVPAPQVPAAQPTLQPGQEEAATSSATGATEEITSDAQQPHQASSAADRRNLISAWTAQGAMHNPQELPAADGSWHWLEEVDRERANALGYHDPVEITMARSRREFDVGIDTSNVVFMPDSVYLNPDTQPEGEGSWAFLTVGEGSARELAWLQLGGQEHFGFGGVQYPSAGQVWTLRQQMIAEGRDLGALDGIDLVWIAASPPSPTLPSTDPSPSTSSNVPSQSPANGGDIDEDVFDPKTHLRHDPLNRGENDQTAAEDTRRYRTMVIDGKQYTCDVSAAVAKRPEPHKMWITNKKGRWTKWLHGDEMDWSDPRWITKLNSWRDQTFKRNDWPSKRPHERPSYSLDQRRWLFDAISTNEGKPPGTEALRQLAEDFNKRWEANRTQAAISALCARLAEMHRENGGEFVPKKGRGQARKEEAALKRKERGEEGDEQGSRKRARRQKSEDDDEDEVMADVESGDETEEDTGDEGDGDDDSVDEDDE